MSSLIMSRRDIDFLLHEWLRVDQLTLRPPHADHSHETFGAALDLYEALAADLFAPHNKKSDQHEPRLEGGHVVLHPEIAAALWAFANSGLLAAARPTDAGGMGLPHVVERAGMAVMMAANTGSMGYAFLTQANANLLLAYASESQKARFVGPMLAGRFFGTMCLSEPQAGSSLAEITTRAELQADGRYRICGSKMWISGGDHEMAENIVHLVLAKIVGADGSLPMGTNGISLFLVPRVLLQSNGTLGERNDVAVVGLNHKMGQRGTVNCALNFGDGTFRPEKRAGAIGELIGDPGKGLACMFHMMNEARIAIGLEAAALGYTGYLHAVEYAQQRVQGKLLNDAGNLRGSVAIAHHPDIKRMLLAQKSYVEGGLALVLYCARLVDERNTAATAEARLRAGQLLDLLTPIGKSWPSQWCLLANDLAIQVHGGYGYTRDYNVEQFYRDNRLNPIHEGTHGIQSLDLLGRKVPLHDGESLRILGVEIQNTIRTGHANAELVEYATALMLAWQSLQEVTESLQEVENVERRLANATPYLEAFGHVVVAWIWLEQAIVALRARAGRSEDGNEFYAGKLMACRYFFRWELPRIYPLLALLSPIDTTCLEMRPEWF